jgi:hypothetical protein
MSLLRKDMYESLYIIRNLRNRIAHHEPIFARDTALDYEIVRSVIAWRSPTAAAWVDHKQTVLKLIPLKP